MAILMTIHDKWWRKSHVIITDLLTTQGVQVLVRMAAFISASIVMHIVKGGMPHDTVYWFFSPAIVQLFLIVPHLGRDRYGTATKPTACS